MGLFRSLSGCVSAELTCADPAAALRLIQSSGIELRNVCQRDTLTFSFDIKRTDIGKLRKIAQHRGDTFRTTAYQGLFWAIKGLQKRPVLVIGLSFLLLLALMLPTRVIFVRVSGNTSVPTRLILEQAAGCGVTLGASTREVRSEIVKNNLLSKIPQLQWVGVNTYGCVAVIDVRERAASDHQEEHAAVSSIVAQRDGLILSVVTEQGTALCKPGDAVVQGQKLISGYTDCGICIRASQAKGEILALTDRQITLLSPTQYPSRAQIQTRQKKFSLIIGKMRINFYKGSGILDATCARIYAQWYITLPGGFVLPVGIVEEEYITYAPLDGTDPGVDLSAAAQRYVLSHTVAGEIVSATETVQERDGLLILCGRYACREYIGMTRIEEKLEDYGKNSG